VNASHESYLWHQIPKACDTVTPMRIVLALLATAGRYDGGLIEISADGNNWTRGNLNYPE